MGVTRATEADLRTACLTLRRALENLMEAGNDYLGEGMGGRELAEAERAIEYATDPRTQARNCATDDGQASGIYVAQFDVWWESVHLGYVDSQKHAEGVIRQHLARRRRGQHAPAYRREYRIVERGVDERVTLQDGGQ